MVKGGGVIARAVLGATTVHALFCLFNGGEHCKKHTLLLFLARKFSRFYKISFVKPTKEVTVQRSGSYYYLFSRAMNSELGLVKVRISFLFF